MNDNWTGQVHTVGKLNCEIMEFLLNHWTNVEIMAIR